MAENKNIIKSRSLWSALLPIVAIAGQQAGLGEGFSQTINQLVVAVIGVAALVLNFMHQRDPKPTTLAAE
jgi:hypothetical protein